MNKLEQAARQIIVDWDSGIHLYEAITALREALAEQSEQEPVLRYAHIKCPVCGVENPGIHECAAPVRTKDPCHPLQDLTDDEINELVYRYAGWELARAVIAADREKNK